MKSGLYRAEVEMSFPANPDPAAPSKPKENECAMITCAQGVFFAKIHPVKITATPDRGCVYCNEMQVTEVIPYNQEGRMHMRPVKYCFNCGRNLQKKEAPSA
jgi:hypothetical protein